MRTECCGLEQGFSYCDDCPGVGRRTGVLARISFIERFWEQARAYTGQNFFVMSWRGPFGKPHLKACREDQ